MEPASEEPNAHKPLWVRGLEQAVAVRKRDRGRPPKVETPEEFEELANAYFHDCTQRDIPPLITGLAVWIGVNKETIRRWGTNSEVRADFRGVVQRARAALELSVHYRLLGAGRGEAAGPIFELKQWGWSDRHETTVKGEVVHRLDVTRMPAEAVDRIANGEDPAVVLATLSEPVMRAIGLLPPGQRIADVGPT